MKELILKVVENERACEGVFRLKLKAAELLPPIKAGQFLDLEVPDSSLLLRRPFCIYDYDKYTVTVYIAIVGKGTEALSEAKIGQELKAILPLGNGFDVSQYKRIGILGGGMGCAALFSCVKTHSKNKEFHCYLGFSTKDRAVFLDDYKKYAKSIAVCTYDGSFGIKGYPLDELKKNISGLDAVLVCGSKSVVKTAFDAFKDIEIPVFVSLEQRMGCGIGACLVCTCGIKDGENITNKRVCADGPVFNLKTVVTQ